MKTRKKIKIKKNENLKKWKLEKIEKFEKKKWKPKKIEN